MSEALVVFVLAVLASTTCAATLGFGANVVAVALAAHVLPVKVVLPAILPTSLLLSGWIASRHRRHVRWDLLGRRVLPLAALGFPLGLAVFGTTDVAPLKRLLGGTVAALALLDLAARAGARRPLPRGVGAALLVLGGFVQGLFASGGPLVVYVLGRQGLDKGSFRSTLATLWVLLNTVLLASYVAGGVVDRRTLTLTAWALPPLVVGLLLGQRLHERVAAEPFRRAVAVLLLLSGLALLAGPG